MAEHPLSDKSQNVLLYKQVEEDIRSKIRRGEWLAGSMLPSRATLAKIYGVSMTTVEQAITLLIGDGTIRAEAKRGTFVAHQGVKAPPLPSAAVPPSAMRINSPTDNASSQFVLGIISPVGNDLNDNPDDVRAFQWFNDDPLADAQTNWTVQMVNSLEQTFSQNGGMMRYVEQVHYESGSTTLSEMLEAFLDNGIDAIAVVNLSYPQPVGDAIYKGLHGKQIPIVLLPWQGTGGPFPCVTYDHAHDGYIATQYLIQAGYTPQAFLALTDDFWEKERLKGVQSAIRNAGLPQEILRIYRNDAVESSISPLTGERGYVTGQQFLAQSALNSSSTDGLYRPPGVIACNDHIAYGFLRALQQADKVVGKDYGLIGFDDLAPSRRLGLTSLRPPITDMGKEAARLLICMLQGQYSTQRVYLSSSIVARSSTSLFG